MMGTWGAVRPSFLLPSCIAFSVVGGTGKKVLRSPRLMIQAGVGHRSVLQPRQGFRVCHLEKAALCEEYHSLRSHLPSVLGSSGCRGGESVCV